MHLSVAVSKVNKWAVRKGGDTLEMIERPDGGLSLVLADGQSSGPGAKAVSIVVVRKVITELADGVRDGAAARAANDSLYVRHRGRVSATLVILSVDMASHSLVITPLWRSPDLCAFSGEWCGDVAPLGGGGARAGLPSPRAPRRG